MSQDCNRCLEGPVGECGHGGLAFYVVGPYPGQHIFRCNACDERWIRHHGSAESIAWTRYSERYAVRKPRAIAPPTHALHS